MNVLIVLPQPPNILEAGEKKNRDVKLQKEIETMSSGRRAQEHFRVVHPPSTGERTRNCTAQESTELSPLPAPVSHLLKTGWPRARWAQQGSWLTGSPVPAHALPATSAAFCTAECPKVPSQAAGSQQGSLWCTDVTAPLGLCKWNKTWSSVS